MFSVKITESVFSLKSLGPFLSPSLVMITIFMMKTTMIRVILVLLTNHSRIPVPDHFWRWHSALQKEGESRLTSDHRLGHLIINTGHLIINKGHLMIKRGHLMIDTGHLMIKKSSSDD